MRPIYGDCIGTIVSLCEIQKHDFYQLYTFYGIKCVLFTELEV